MKLIFKYSSLLILALSVFFITYTLERGEFGLLITGSFLSMISYFYLIKIKGLLKTREIIIWAIFFRFLLLFSVPNLSDDYFRFIWDGQMIAKGENPYLILPSEEIKTLEIKTSKFYNKIYEGMNSKEYYTVYPPLNQMVFSMASYFSGNNIYVNVLLLKLILFLFEIGMLLVLFSLLKKLKMAANLAVIYAFNPLVIIELVGNIHFEGMMLFFFILGILLLLKNNTIWAGIFFSFAISIKLLPLMLLPLIIKFIGWKRSIVFYLVIGFVSLLLFFPFLSSELVSNFGSSIDLYFQKFEFNASFYYLLRWLGYQITGYNQIGLIGSILPVFIIMFILFVSFKQFFKKMSINDKFSEFIKNSFYIVFIYYSLASIVHPWYVINLVVLSVFIKNKLALVWSFTVFLSYFAYSNYVEINYMGDKHQSSLYFLFVFIEYVLLLGYLAFDSLVNNKQLLIKSK